jgi:uncharacterized membrane protein
MNIHQMDAFGVMHTTFALLSVVLGLLVVLVAKGTPLHRRVGLLYAVSMLLLNLTFFAIYKTYRHVGPLHVGYFGPFHALALVSLATIGAGLVPVWLRKPAGRWLELHARCMSWSYAGLVAALWAEISSRFLGFGLTSIVAPTVAVIAIAAVAIRLRLPRTLRAFVDDRTAAAPTLALVVAIAATMSPR